MFAFISFGYLSDAFSPNFMQSFFSRYIFIGKSIKLTKIKAILQYQFYKIIPTRNH